MGEDIMPQWFGQLFALYGPAAVPIIGLLLIIKYLLDKDKQRENAINLLQAELLKEARGNATLAEELKKALYVLASKGIS